MLSLDICDDLGRGAFVELRGQSSQLELDGEFEQIVETLGLRLALLPRIAPDVEAMSAHEHAGAAGQIYLEVTHASGYAFSACSKLSLRSSSNGVLRKSDVDQTSARFSMIGTTRVSR